MEFKTCGYVKRLNVCYTLVAKSSCLGFMVGEVTKKEEVSIESELGRGDFELIGKQYRL